MLKRLFRWAVMAFLGLAVVAALLYAAIDLIGARDWAKCQAEMKAKGEALTFEELVPPPVPDEQNLAMLPVFREMSWDRTAPDKPVDESK